MQQWTFIADTRLTADEDEEDIGNLIYIILRNKTKLIYLK